MPDLTEHTLDSQQVFDGKLLKVYRDEVRLPDGQTSVREWIDHRGAAAALPLFDDGSTLLLRQFRYPARRTFLEVPAGKIDEDDETPEAVAGRELEEETGWRAGRLLRLGDGHPCIGYSNEVIHFFLATDLTKGTRNLAEGEFVEPVRLPFDEAVQRARRGEIDDMKTLVALFLAASHLNGSRYRSE